MLKKKCYVNNILVSWRKETAMVVKNKNTNMVILDRVEISDSFYTRFKGLMGRTSLEKGSGMKIDPCNSIHCFFMKIPIDVLFVSKDHTVIKIISDMKPWKVSPLVRGASYVIEANGNELTGKVKIGDRLDFIEN